MQANKSNGKQYGRTSSPLTRYLYMGAGFVSLSLGILGIPLPLLPTTPFLLLSAWLFARSSEKFYIWLINHRYFGEIIRNYREKQGVSLQIKVFSIMLLWISISLSAFLAVEAWWVRVLLLLIAVGVSWHIISLKTID